ncbi:Hypothetical_protein [Hexamita inflata]|uniref:Hypothetical_protein n=1 Tax=Hexamita inflata TaxID=28002 RepID=A0AA86REL1_9EUKA|nr:Hypothetical protein HINF_LOCUS60958 [Hexamita inflata]
MINLGEFVTADTVIEEEHNFSCLLFTDEAFMKEMLKKYTLLQCSHGGTMHCFFRQLNGQVEEMKKNITCNRHSGKRSFTVKTYIKDFEQEPTQKPITGINRLTF